MFDPFMLPVCERCEGATFLASVVPNDYDARDERTYRCRTCGAEHTSMVKRQPRAALAGQDREG